MSLIKKLSKIKCHIMSVCMPSCRTKQIYKSNFGKNPNLKKPVNINEKIQYLKLNSYYNNPIVTNCIDKYKIREYLTKKGLKDILPQLYGVYDSADEIPFTNLPESFAIKCNHGCGYNIICPNKSDLDIEQSKKLLKKWMKQDFWKEYAEVQYKFIKKRIIIEQFLGENISTYKFYCFNGIPKVLYTSACGENGEKDLYIDYFDMNWKHLDISLLGHAHHPKYNCIEMPKNFERMKEIACTLSQEFPFVRIDLYNIDGNIYISEMTFVPTGGFMRLLPEGTAEEWGSWLDIKIS